MNRLINNNTGNIKFVEVSDEPIHKELFQNDYLRLYIANIPPGGETLYHRHSRDTVYVVLEGGVISTQVVGIQKLNTFKFPKSFSLLSKLRLGIGSIIFGSMKLTKEFFFIMLHEGSPVIHRAIASKRNLKDMRLVGIELIKLYKNNKFVPLKSKYFETAFEADDFIVYRLSLESGQSTGLLEHDSPGLFVAVNGVVEIKHCGTTPPTKAALEVGCGEFCWLDYSSVYNITNICTKHFIAIIVMLK